MADETTATPAGDAPLRSVLHAWHEAAGARFGDFAGWSMPLEYAGGGVVAEHQAVRTGVGLFDVSHLGKVWVRGAGAVAFLNACLTNDLSRIPAGKAQYSLCCTTAGGVVDDLIVYRFADDELLLIPNAANTAEVARLLGAQAPEGVEVRDVHRDYAVIAVQGPDSDDVLAAMALPTDMPYFGFARTVWGDVDLTVCRTGYTGEHGYELVVPVADAVDVWETLIEAGEPWEIRAAGLGARDTLRTEMGYPLHGQDISPVISPLQARLGWAIGWTKPEFWGHAALRAEKAAGPARLLVGVRHSGRRIPRAGMTVHVGDAEVGVVTSGTFGPTAGVGIGLALVDRDHATPGSTVELDLRGRREPYEVVRPPFVDTDV
jgi:aminomethyltransferase